MPLPHLNGALLQQVAGPAIGSGGHPANQSLHGALDVASLNAALNSALAGQASIKLAPPVVNGTLSNLHLPDRRRYSTTTSLLTEEDPAAVAAAVGNQSNLLNAANSIGANFSGARDSAASLSQLAAAVAAAANATNAAVNSNSNATNNNNNGDGTSPHASDTSAVPVSSVPVEAGGSTAIAANAAIMEQLKIQAADMPMYMQKFAIQSASNALQLYTTEKHIAESIKQDFDSEYQPTWHCIVGRNWGSCVTHSKQCYIRMLYKELTILLYKSS